MRARSKMKRRNFVYVSGESRRSRITILQKKMECTGLRVMNRGDFEIKHKKMTKCEELCESAK